MFTARAFGEGKWPMLVLLALTVATVLWCPARWAALVPGVLLAFVIAFFRDPARAVPPDPRAIVAPGDGKIVEVKPVESGTLLAIFLSVFDGHVQRAPVAGTITAVRYQPGKFFDARRPEAATQNERREIVIETTDGFRVTIRQIAGAIARRIVGWTDDGAVVQKGDRLGMIKFGSRVELVLPAGVEVVAQVGDRAKGGETIVARRK